MYGMKLNPSMLDGVNREKVLAILLLNGIVTPANLSRKFASRYDKVPAALDGERATAAFIERQGSCWGLSIQDGSIRMELTQKTLDTLEELPTMSAYRLRIVREKVAECLVSHVMTVSKELKIPDMQCIAQMVKNESYSFEDIEERYGWELDDDHAANVFIKYVAQFYRLCHPLLTHE